MLSLHGKKSRNYYYRQTQKTVNTSKISAMLIVYWPITTKFRIRKQTSKSQIYSWPEIPDNATAHARDYLAIWPPNIQRKCVAEIKQ